MRTTYLFGAGAGASANAIPIVKKFSKGLLKAKEKLAKVDFGNETIYNQPANELYSNIKNSFLEDLIWLYEESIEHASVDTFAKKLYLQKDDNYVRLKKTLSSFFVLYQSLKKLDVRYDLFFATLLSSDENGELSFPQNINILSWNYDTQFELSYLNFLFNAFDEEGLKRGLRLGEPLDITKFNFIKLNGTAGHFISKKEKEAFRHNVPHQKKFESQGVDKVEIFRKALLHYVFCENGYNETSLTFSWENNDIPKDVRSRAIDILKPTNIMIVIGYSFPTFNRSIDSELLNAFDGYKIVVQAPSGASEIIKQRITSLALQHEGKIEVRNEIDEFYIPNPLT